MHANVQVHRGEAGRLPPREPQLSKDLNPKDPPALIPSESAEVQESLLSPWGGLVLGFMETFSLQQLNQQLCAFAEEVNEFSHLGPGHCHLCCRSCSGWVGRNSLGAWTGTWGPHGTQGCLRADAVSSLEELGWERHPSCRRASF